MRFMTDDDVFGLRVSPVADLPVSKKFFRFQLIIDSIVMGDMEPCILGTAMHQLQNLPVLEDASLGRSLTSPKDLLSVLRSSPEVNDLSLLPLAESLDQWSVRGFIHGSSAVLMGWQRKAQESAISIARVPLPEYRQLVRFASLYWRDLAES